MKHWTDAWITRYAIFWWQAWDETGSVIIGTFFFKRNARRCLERYAASLHSIDF